MKYKILLVDDDPSSAKVTEFRLNKAGYDVAVAYNGKEAFEKIGSKKPNLIILDYRLPDTNGVDIAKTLKADINFRSIPLILLTGMEEMSGEIVSENFVAFFKKPFDHNAILEKIKKFLPTINE